MILLSFRRERRNFMACKRVGEQNIYFRDVYIIHLARSEREREKKHDRNAKAGERKSRKHHSTTSAPVCLQSFSALCSTAESSHLLSSSIMISCFISTYLYICLGFNASRPTWALCARSWKGITLQPPRPATTFPRPPGGKKKERKTSGSGGLIQGRGVLLEAGIYLEGSSKKTE